jgi:hypothetical protein
MAVAYFHRRPAHRHEYAVWLRSCAAGRRPHHIDAAIIATVVPPTLFNLRRLPIAWKYFQ